MENPDFSLLSDEILQQLEAYKKVKDATEEALKQKDYDKAIAICEKGLEELPEEPELYNDIGKIYLELKQLDKAESYLKKAINIDETYWKAYNNLAITYKRLGNFELAIGTAKAGLLHDIDNAFIFNTLANIHATMGKKTEALEFYQKAHELQPESSIFKYNYANYLYTLGLNNEAFRLYLQLKDCETLDKNKQLQVCNILAYFYRGLPGGKDDLEVSQIIVELLEKFLSLEPSPPKYSIIDLISAHRVLGYAYYELSNYEKSLLNFSRALELEPERKLSNYSMIANVYWQLNQYQKAEDFYRQYIRSYIEDGETDRLFDLIASGYVPAECCKFISDIYKDLGYLEIAELYLEKGNKAVI